MYRKYFHRILSAACIICICHYYCYAQAPENDPGFIDELIEDLFADDEALSESSIADIYESLGYYLRSPIKINEIDREFFESTQLLNAFQINAFIDYKKEFGPFVALEELQVIEGFSADIVQRLRPFVRLSGEDDFLVSIPKMLSSGKSTLYLKWQSVLEDQKGYDEDLSNGYLGSNDKLNLRYRYEYENRLRFGFLAEKDAGEEFFQGSNKNGFDYYSAYLQLKDYKGWLKDLIIGDYSISIGQGLVLHNDFGTGKSSFVSDIRKGGRVIRSYSSLAENNFLRGAAATFKLGQNVEISPYVSRAKKDGSLQTDTLAAEDFFNGVLESGNHRTVSELSKKDQIEETAAGLYAKYKTDDFIVGVYGSYFKYNADVRRNSQLYNQFRFQGDKIIYTGLDYGLRINNFNFFGEVSLADNNSLSYLSGVLIALNPKVSLSVLYRNYDVDFPTINSNAFGESTEANNESGLYSGIFIRLDNNWSISSYLDIWSFPWLRFQVDKPSTGYEFLNKIEYRVKRKFNAYVQYRHEKKEENFFLDEQINPVLNRYRNNLRLHFEYYITRNLILRNRFEFAFYDHGTESENGFLIYQDVIYKPIGESLSFTARYALFDTDGFNSRIYTYENDLLYEFFIPSFSNRGSRFYLNMRYLITYDLMFEARYERTYLENREGISSGLEFIDGNTRSKIKAQIKYKF